MVFIGSGSAAAAFAAGVELVSIAYAILIVVCLLPATSPL